MHRNRKTGTKLKIILPERRWSTAISIQTDGPSFDIRVFTINVYEPRIISADNEAMSSFDIRFEWVSDWQRELNFAWYNNKKNIERFAHSPSLPSMFGVCSSILMVHHSWKCRNDRVSIWFDANVVVDGVMPSTPNAFFASILWIWLC